jgi:uncharacterized SAM-binding protein YcdF (DUF218 family)
MALQLAAAAAFLAAPAASRRWGGRGRFAAWGAPAALLAASLLLAGSYSARKWLGALLMPAGVVWLVLGTVTVVLFHRRRRAARLVLALFLLYWLSANEWLATAALRWLERDYDEAPVAPAQPLEAVVLLGGGASQRPWPELQLAPSGDRVATAARWYHRGWAQRVVCSVPPGHDGLEEQMPVLLAELGVPDEAVSVLVGPTNTGEEIDAVAGLVRDRGWSRVGVVSSAWHMRRVLGHARRAGIELVPAAADFRGGFYALDIVAVVPSGTAAERLRIAAWEIVGALVAR